MRKYWIPLVILAAVAVLAVGIKLYLSNIYIAAQMGNAARITKILEKKPELVNTLSRAGRTPLHYAANGGHIDAVKALLANGADVEAERSGGFTPIHDAIVKKHRAVAELLTAHGAKIPNELSRLYIRHDVAHLLLELGADVNKIGTDEWSPLTAAAFCGSTDVLNLLLDHGADVNAMDKYERTALGWAAGRGEAEAAELLIVNGATIDAKNKNGLTPLCFAIMSSQLKVAEILLANGADVNVVCNGGMLLHIVAAKGKPYKRPLWPPLPIPGGEPDEDHPYDIARLLINYGVDVNSKDDDLRTPLHQAAEFGIPEVTKLLLKNGADVNVKDDLRGTPLLYAVRQNGNLEIIKLLLEHGADVNAKTPYGTPLTVAKDDNDTKMVKLLLEYGANE